MPLKKDCLNQAMHGRTGCCVLIVLCLFAQHDFLRVILDVIDCMELMDKQSLLLCSTCNQPGRLCQACAKFLFLQVLHLAQGCISNKDMLQALDSCNDASTTGEMLPALRQITFKLTSGNAGILMFFIKTALGLEEIVAMLDCPCA